MGKLKTKVKEIQSEFNDWRHAEDFVKEGYYVQEGLYTDASRYAPSTLQGYLARANGTITQEKTNGYVFDAILGYSRDIGRHNLDATLVSTRDYTTYDVQKTMGTNFAANGNTLLGIAGLQKATLIEVTQDGRAAANIGYLARVMYAYDRRYSMTASYRRDGASFFGANRKWAGVRTGLDCGNRRRLPYRCCKGYVDQI